LLATAGLKTIDLTQRPVDFTWSRSSHVVTALVSYLEVSVGLLLLVGCGLR
jgi:hypothetical protein